MCTVRNGNREYNLRWLLFAFIGAIAIWVVVFAFSYFSARALCEDGVGWVLHLIAAVGIIIASASIIAAIRFIRFTSDVPEQERSPRDERTRFLGTQGLILGVFVVFSIIGMEIVNAVILCQ